MSTTTLPDIDKHAPLPVGREASDNTVEDGRSRAPLVLDELDLAGVTHTVCGITERRMPTAWYVAMAISVPLLVMFVGLIGYLLTTGVGVWGNNQPVSWAFPIVNFVFWVGIGHAGTLISAILFLFRQKWRTSINRFAEAMTIFAVTCAGVFPLIHTGRPWLGLLAFPIPETRCRCGRSSARRCCGTCLRSPLMRPYRCCSGTWAWCRIWPPSATGRPRRSSRSCTASSRWAGPVRAGTGIASSGAYLLLAALATPLVLSVHSVVSFDFAVSQLPGWHTTIFPPYFVAGAVFGGFAMVITLAVPARELFGLKRLITLRHLENMNKIMLATGMIVAYAYAVEFFTGWYSGHSFEQFVFMNRPLGPFAWAFWIMVGCNVVAPQFLWLKKIRTNPWTMLVIAMCVNVGMWFERFVIVVTSLHRDFLPSSWGTFKPTWVDIGTLVGSFGLFFTPVPAVLPLSADGGDGRGENGHAPGPRPR
jgi:Ni/Fe-hydrogenase subunit HybB-like protein